MRIWQGYGSEHSAKLVMIGKFKEPSSAREALEAIESITAQAGKEYNEGILDDDSTSYSQEMLGVMQKYKIFGISPDDLSQFCQDVRIEQNGNNLHITTDETDVSAFMMALIMKSAKVEIFSKHDFPDEDQE